jgi:predicted Holliday junction resolvase-like endonuclease
MTLFQRKKRKKKQMNWIDIVIAIFMFGITYLYYKAGERAEILGSINQMLLQEIQALNEKLSVANESQYKNSLKLEKLTEELDSSKNKSILALENYEESIRQINQMKLDHVKELKKASEDALTKSRAVMRGQATEHLAPYILKDTNPKDYRFMGNPVDYILFDGLSDVLDGESDSIKSITFVDIKTGKSNLTKSQRRIRDAIASNLIKFELINLDKVLSDEENISETERGDSES